MEKINNPYTAIDRICHDLIDYLKSIPHDDFDAYPNAWCAVLEYNLQTCKEDLEEPYDELMISFIKDKLLEICDTSVINWLCLEYHNAFNDPLFNEAHGYGLNTENYEEYPLTEECINDAAQELLNRFGGWDHYDPDEERMEGYRKRYYEKGNDIAEITDALIKFREERDWEQFHNAKDLSLALSIEAAELNELFLWKKAEDAASEKVKQELADVFTYAFLLAHKYGFDIKSIILAKLKQSEEKYPVEKAKGSAKKYNEL